MSKALRTVTDLQLPSVWNLSSNWHPFYADMSGNNPPCLPEFMKLMNCVNDKKTTECNSYYLDLLHCLHKQGFDKD